MEGQNVNKKTFYLQFFFLFLLTFCLVILNFNTYIIDIADLIIDFDLDIEPLLTFWTLAVTSAERIGFGFIYAGWGILLYIVFLIGLKFRENHRFLLGLQITNLALFILLVKIILSVFGFFESLHAF